ncbi:hypothetical protein [Xanthomarina gelatinilytica]|uniref:hypothetical protein n=1 Tax=Xanthomarina gelatinilytica TaxID=1137281 RepID=UPI003AA867BC
MDSSHYKDYMLVMLFIKCISDKWAGQLLAPITIPKGESLSDMNPIALFKHN